MVKPGYKHRNSPQILCPSLSPHRPGPGSGAPFWSLTLIDDRNHKSCGTGPPILSGPGRARRPLSELRYLSIPGVSHRRVLRTPLQLNRCAQPSSWAAAFGLVPGSLPTAFSRPGSLGSFSPTGQRTDLCCPRSSRRRRQHDGELSLSSTGAAASSRTQPRRRRRRTRPLLFQGFAGSASARSAESHHDLTQISHVSSSFVQFRQYVGRLRQRSLTRLRLVSKPGPHAPGGRAFVSCAILVAAPPGGRPVLRAVRRAAAARRCADAVGVQGGRSIIPPR